MVYLIGASGHAKVILEILEQQNLQIGGLVDLDPSIQTLLGYPVNNMLPSEFNVKDDSVIISIGNNITRKKNALGQNYHFSKAVHPASNVSTRVKLGSGTVVMAGVSINSGVEIGNHVIINTNSSIDHDCLIGDYVHISPNVALAGNVCVGEGAHLGIGSCVIQGIKVGRWSTVGAGSIVIKDVPDFAVVVGNPGKIIKYNSYDAG